MTVSDCKFGMFLGTLLLANMCIADPQTTIPSTTSTQAVNEKAVWNLKEVDIRSVIEQVSKATGKNFVVDPKVSGKVTLISTEPMDKEALYQAFLSVLQVSGYAAVPTGDVIKIVLANDAKQMAIPLVDKQAPGQGDEVVVRVIHANNVQASKLLYILQPLMPQSGHVAVYAPNNSLILSGAASHVDRIAGIVARIDSANASDVAVVPLKNISAEDAVNMLAALDTDNVDKSQPRRVSYVANNRDNSVVLKGDQQNLARFRKVLREIDTPSKNAFNATRVIYLHYLKAKDFAPILSNLIAGTSATASSTPSNTGSTSSMATTPTVSPMISSMRTGAHSVGDTVIQAEPTSNALIVKAMPSAMQTLLSIIKNLDVRPAQVLVEAAIVEISDSMANQLGIQWNSINTPDPGNNPLFKNISGITIGFLKSGSIQGIINALASDGNVNILSTPSIMVTNNQEAKIEIGKTVSVRGTQYANTSPGTSTGAPITTFNREKVGLHLYVTPQISQGDTIQLLIDQANDSIATASTDANQDPVFNNRVIKTNVMVDDGAILVLGGLITNETNESISKIPVLGNLPGIGALFQYKSQSRDRKNLMVFLKPVIVRDNKAGKNLTSNKYEYLRQQQLIQSKQPAYWVPHPQGPQLPAWNKAVVLPEPFAQQPTEK